MSQRQVIQVTSDSPDQTEALARRIGEGLKGGEVIELVSDLGGGKTTFVRGLAAGFGSKDKVASPTFTLSKVYKHGNQEMHHFDFYRLPEAGLIAHELEEVIDDPNCTVVVEWAGIVQQVLPEDHLRITIVAKDQNTRQFTFSCPPSLRYLLVGIN